MPNKNLVRRDQPFIKKHHKVGSQILTVKELQDNYPLFWIQ